MQFLFPSGALNIRGQAHILPARSRIRRECPCLRRRRYKARESSVESRDERSAWPKPVQRRIPKEIARNTRIRWQDSTADRSSRTLDKEWSEERTSCRERFGARF